MSPPPRAAPLLLALAVALLALGPRAALALRGYWPSNDAAEHLLLARALARGDGFQLPIRVRDVDGGPAVHPAFEERAPLFPLLLAAPVAAGVGWTGWPDPRLQLVNVGLAALAAALAALVAHALARARGLAPWPALLAALAAGLVVAWGPSLLRASLHLWAEPLGLVLVLGALLAQLKTSLPRGGSPGSTRGLTWAAPSPTDGTRPRSGPPRTTVGEGGVGAVAPPRSPEALAVAPHLAILLAALARFARPEAWVLTPIVVLLALRRSRRDGALAAAIALAVNAVGVAWTGVLAPQLALLRVARFEDALGAGARAAAPTAGDVLSGVAGNLAAQLSALLEPRTGWLVLPAALLAAWPARRAARGAPAAAACGAFGVGLLLATTLVWSTRDPHRFGILPLGCLAPLAAVEVEALAGALRARSGPRARAAVRAVWLVGLVLVLGAAARRERRLPPRPPVEPRSGTPTLRDPWSYALATGRPALLGPRAR